MGSIDTKIIQAVIAVSAIAFLFLANVTPGIGSLWVLSPLIIIYARVVIAGKRGNSRHITAVKGFLFLVLPLMWFVHIQWYFDIAGAATGSSSSALIFAVLPIYCLIPGAVGYIIGYAAGSGKDRAWQVLVGTFCRDAIPTPQLSCWDS